MSENIENNEENNNLPNENTEEQNLPSASFLRKKLIIFLVIILMCTSFLTFLLTPTYTYKPAIYLYSEKPIKVSIKLDNLLIRDTTIPKYSNGWLVLADKDGRIKDLQPQKTNCSKLQSGFGFEYAKDACLANNYPYIYWDGISFKKLIKKDSGWSVKKEDIEKFLTEKAQEIGMNDGEKAEFVRYWTHKVKNYPSNYFTIYFLQNKEVDDYVKLKVSPKPESWNRVQIIITPSFDKKYDLQPYKLEKINREGFTLVEWGGVINDKKNKGE